MIIKPGQYELRLKELKAAYELKAADVKGVVAIELEQVPAIHMDMAYTARLTKSGKGELKEELRFIRKRTTVRLLDKDGGVVWSNRKQEEPEPALDIHQ